MLGCPVLRNRSWILDKYLQGIYNLNYPKDQIHLAFVLNGTPTDDTGTKLYEFAQKFTNEYKKISILNVRNNNIDSRGKRNYNKFANMRNLFIQMRNKDDEQIFSVDSDIILDPETLNILGSHQKDIVSALVQNGKTQFLSHYNIMNKRSDGRFYHIHELDGLMDVDLTGACILINKYVLDDNVIYGNHPQGEDAYFCELAKKMGYKMYCDTNHEVEHFLGDF